MAKILVKESVMREIIKNQVIRVLNEKKALKKINEAYFGDGGDDEEYQGLQNFPQDNTDYDLVYRLCERFPKVGEQRMADGVSAVWNYTKSEKENILSLKDYFTTRVNENKVIEEGVATNNPKIEKYVSQINDLISQAFDTDGDPIGVVDPNSTWGQSYVYEPIVYQNGALKIVSYPSNDISKKEVDIIKSTNMEFDGIPTLQLLSRMYKKALKTKQVSEDIEVQDDFITDDFVGNIKCNLYEGSQLFSDKILPNTTFENAKEYAYNKLKEQMEYRKTNETLWAAFYIELDGKWKEDFSKRLKYNK